MYLRISGITLRQAQKKTKLHTNRLMDNHKKVRFSLTFWNIFLLFCMQNVTKCCLKVI